MAKVDTKEGLKGSFDGLVASINAKGKGGLTREIPLSQIRADPQQPRRVFDSEPLEHLIQSVRQKGILSPLWLRPDDFDEDDGPRYLLIAGERRYRAAQAAGLSTVPARIFEDLDELQTLELSLIENLQRQDLNPLEEVEGLLHLLASRLDQELASLPNFLEAQRKTPDETVVAALELFFSQYAKTTWQSFVVHKLPVLRLPLELLNAMRVGRLNFNQAKELNRQLKSLEPAVRTQILSDLEAGIVQPSDLGSRLADALADAKELGVRSSDPSFKSVKRRLSKVLTPHNFQKLDEIKRKKVDGLLEQLKKLLEG